MLRWAKKEFVKTSACGGVDGFKFLSRCCNLCWDGVMDGESNQKDQRRLVRGLWWLCRFSSIERTSIRRCGSSRLS
jgi:hypothetical protein